MMNSSSMADSNWSKDRLMGKNVSFKGVNNISEGEATTLPANGKNADSKEKIDPMLWGRPGHLTEEETEIYVSSCHWHCLLLRLLRESVTMDVAVIVKHMSKLTIIKLFVQFFSSNSKNKWKLVVVISNAPSIVSVKKKVKFGL